MRIVALCVAAAVVYGIVHDQITARICVEYFTIGHVRIIDSESPTVLGLLWGVIATWWMGLLLGIPLAIAARAGTRRAPRDVRTLVRPISIVLAVMGGCALVAGVIGHLLASVGFVILLEPLASRVPADRHVAFLTALWAHSASYIVGGLTGLALVVIVWRSRRRTPATTTET